MKELAANLLLVSIFFYKNETIEMQLGSCTGKRKELLSMLPSSLDNIKKLASGPMRGL